MWGLCVTRQCRPKQYPAADKGETDKGERSSACAMRYACVACVRYAAATASSRSSGYGRR